MLDISTLGNVVSFGTLLAFTIVCIGIMILRYTRPEIPRPFRTPWVPVVPILGAVISLALMFNLSHNAILFAGIWLVLGLVIYFLYSRHHSKLTSGK